MANTFAASILQSLNKPSDERLKFTVVGHPVDVKTSKKSPIFAFSRANRCRNKSDIIAFASIRFHHDGSAWVELEGWATRGNVVAHLTQGSNFFDCDLTVLKRHGVLHRPESLLHLNQKETR